MSILASRNGRGQVCAQIIPGDKLTKYAKQTKHMLRSPRGWAFDVPILEQASEYGVGDVEVIDTESETTFTTQLGEFWKHGILIDRGHGRQRVLPIKYWKLSSPHFPEQLELFPA
jgi:hypothetical protein